MKIILTGSTGFIGQEVLLQCLSHPQITSLIVLSRRALPVSDPKVKVVLLEDFTRIPEDVLEELKGSDGCIWALGTTSLDPKISRRVNLDYTLSACSEFSKLVDEGKKFRFVYCSGALAARDQGKKLWFLSEGRKIRGEVETRLLTHSAPQPQSFEPIIARPAMVLAKEGSIFTPLVLSTFPSIKVDELAAALIEAAVAGWKGEGAEGRGWIIENEMLRRRGREVRGR